MTRHNNIVISYLIVKEYKEKTNKALLPYQLISYITRRLGVTDATAKQYLMALENGIRIKGKKYQIGLQDGGYGSIDN